MAKLSGYHIDTAPNAVTIWPVWNSVIIINGNRKCELDEKEQGYKTGYEAFHVPTSQEPNLAAEFDERSNYRFETIKNLGE